MGGGGHAQSTEELKLTGEPPIGLSWPIFLFAIMPIFQRRNSQLGLHQHFSFLLSIGSTYGESSCFKEAHQDVLHRDVGVPGPVRIGPVTLLQCLHCQRWHFLKCLYVFKRWLFVQQRINNDIMQSRAQTRTNWVTFFASFY